MKSVLERAALSAGAAIMDVFSGQIAVTIKPDASPVTEADRRAEEIILAELARAYPDVPLVAEELASSGHISDVSGGRFFLVDPLDGTKEFIGRREDFTVNIALIENGVPVVGIVYAPAKGVLYYGDRKGAERVEVSSGFETLGRRGISTRRGEDDEDLVAVVSRSHLTEETMAFLAQRNIRKHVSVGSSLKFCLVAEGIADVYPRFGRTMEWDTAAGDAVLRAAGGMTLASDGAVLCYGKPACATDVAFATPNFVAYGTRVLDAPNREEAVLKVSCVLRSIDEVTPLFMNDRVERDLVWASIRNETSFLDE